MTVYESPEKKSGFEFRKTDFLDENGSKAYAFVWKARSYGFRAETDDIWFYRDDILAFLRDAAAVLYQGQTRAVLNAMSGFAIILESVDNLGHFSVRIDAENRVHQNSARITAKLETQTVSEFIMDLEQMISD